MKALLGIDIGTSAAKTVVMDPSGQLLAASVREYPIDTPQPGWAEQDPQHWLEAAIATTREAVGISGIRPELVAGIGFTGQMHSMVCLDERMQVLRPAIIWADQRSGEQVRRLIERIGVENLGSWVGNPLAAGFMLASWAWMLENEPHLASRTRLLMLPKDWVRYQLTGQICTEPSDASSTLLFDPHTRTWSEPVLGAVGLPADYLPPIQPSHTLAGRLLPDLAAACGLPEGIVVAAGCSDVSAQALAMGVVDPGSVSVTIGTGGQLFAPVKEPVHDPALRMHLFCHALPGVWHHEAAILTGGLALRWLRDGFWPPDSYQQLADQAVDVEAGLDGLFFFPYLSGERTPWMDPNLRGAFIGCDLRHTRAHMIRAVMEGVAFSLRQGFELMPAASMGQNFLHASGGASRHPLWLQLVADIFDRPLVVNQAQEATARGAALLGGVASGLYKTIDGALRLTARTPGTLLSPETARAARYEMAYRQYVRWSSVLAAEYREGAGDDQSFKVQ